jgi:serine protease Do/serine protease DegQ
VPELAGAVFKDLPADHPLAKKVGGVLIAGLQEGSPAWRYGLREGDVIVGVNREETPTVKRFVELVKQADRIIAMNVIRNGNALFIVIQR